MKNSLDSKVQIYYVCSIRTRSINQDIFKKSEKFNSNPSCKITFQLNLLLDRQGSTVLSSVNGKIDSSVKLSGNPDLRLSWMNPKVFTDVHFHPCIRLKRWNVEKLLSFIPPDGQFQVLVWKFLWEIRLQKNFKNISSSKRISNITRIVILIPSLSN